MVLNLGFRCFNDINRNSTKKCIYAFSFPVGNHREPQSINAKLFLPIISIGVVAYAFTLLRNNLCQNSCIAGVPANLMLGVTLLWTSIPSKGGSRNIPSRSMLLNLGYAPANLVPRVSLLTAWEGEDPGNEVVLRPGRPLGSYANADLKGQSHQISCFLKTQ